jgi:hypothetical protein
MSLKDLIVVISIVALVALFLGCTSSTSNNTNGAAMNAANVTADKILNSLNTGNYNEFSGNFSTAMSSVMNQSQFSDYRNDFQSEYGNYTSRAPVPTTTVAQGDNVYLYKSSFEKGNITLELAMNITDVWRVDGLYLK